MIVVVWINKKGSQLIRLEKTPPPPTILMYKMKPRNTNNKNKTHFVLVGTKATNTLRPYEGRVLVINLCMIVDVLASREKRVTKIYSFAPDPNI